MNLTDLLGEEADEAARRIEQFARALLRRSYGGNPFVQRWEDDIVQQVLMTAVDWAGRVARGQAAVRNTDAWLVRVVFNTKNQVWRRTGSGREVDCVEPEAHDADSPSINLTDRLSLHQALQRLDDQCRELLIRFHAVGESTKTIAASSGLSPGNVRVRLHRCRRRLFVIHESDATASA